MGRRGRVWNRNMVIPAAELEAMTEALVSRPETDRVEFHMGHVDSPYVFYYGIAWKAGNYEECDIDDDFDDE